MSYIVLVWIAVLALVGALCFFGGDASRRRQARIAFVLLVTAFVVQSLVAAAQKGGRLESLRPVMEADRAEILLRFSTTIRLMEDQIGTADFKRKDFYDESAQILREAIDNRPQSDLLKARLAVLLADSGKAEKKKESLALARELAARTDSRFGQGGKAIETIYGRNSIAQKQAKELETSLKDVFPEGWYRNAALLRLYKVSGQTEKYKELRQEIEDSSARLLVNFIIAVVVGLGVSLIGLVVIVVQLFTLPRRLGRPEDEAGGAQAVPWGWQTVYAVFLFWLATQLLLGDLAQHLTKSMALMASGAFIAAATTASLYIVSNGPGMLYAYLLAMRPHGMGFLEGFRIRLKSGTLGPVKLCFAGAVTWCAAVPIVMVAYLLASKYLGSQGSSNPIIALVMEAARSADYAAIALFYLTLGLLAPLCEETLFRGFLYRSLRKRLGVGTSLTASAAVFSAVHMDAGAMVPLFCLGWLFGFVFERTRSLVPAIVAHGLWNSGTFTLVLLIFSA